MGFERNPQLAGPDVARDGHFCGKSGTQIGGNDHWSPVGDEKDEGAGRDRASNSRIVWRAWWSSLAANVERGWVQATTWTTNDAWFITSPRVDAQCAHATPKTQTNQRTFGNRKRKRARGRTWAEYTSSRQDRLWLALPREGIWLYPWRESLTSTTDL